MADEKPLGHLLNYKRIQVLITRQSDYSSISQ